MTMNMPTKLNSQDNVQKAALEIIEEIKAISADSECIYRGEPEDTGKIFSSLYREFADCDEELIDLELVQRDMIGEVKQYLYKKNDLDILTELQHYGGKTNLIDFTTNHLIALFFACYGALGEDGRVIVQKTAMIEDWILKPKNPRHRLSAQEIVFVQPPKGFIEPDKSQIVTIPANLKQPLLQHLRTEHNISTDTMFNDLYSFIRKQEIHRDAYSEYYSGLSLQKIGDEADSNEKEKAAYTEAVGCYTKAITLKPDFLNSYKNRGIVYTKMGDDDSAIEDYNTVIQLDPNYSKIYFYRGVAYLGKNELDQSIEDFTKEIELNPTNVLYFYRGVVSLLNQESTQALKDFSMAIELNPEFYEAYQSRGLVYAVEGKVDLAIQDFTKAIELKPDDSKTYLERGNVYAKIDDHEHAIQDFGKVIDLDPEEGTAYNDRGIAYAKKGDYERAIQDFSKTIELDPEKRVANINRGSAYADKGDLERAMQDYDKAIELDPEDNAAYYNRGESSLHLQEWEKAKSDLTTAKNMGYDIIESFRNDYENVKDFEQKTNIELPADIAAMLTPPQQSQ